MFKSLYPSLMGEFNIAPNTQIGMINMPNQIYAYENLRKSEKFVRSGDFIEHFASHNWLEVCRRYLNLASFEEMINDIFEYLDKYEIPQNRVYGITGLPKVFFHTDKRIEKKDELLNKEFKYIEYPIKDSDEYMKALEQKI